MGHILDFRNSIILEQTLLYCLHYKDILEPFHKHIQSELNTQMKTNTACDVKYYYLLKF